MEHIKFANSRIGYAYGRTSLFMTTDGGARWIRESGHADALTIVGSTVIRVSAPCCPPAVRYQVQLAALGSTSWRGIPIPGGVVGDAVAAVGDGVDAYIELYENPAAGAGIARSSLFVTTDAGRSWARRDEPCPQIGGGAAGDEVDGAAIALAPDGSVTVLCEPRGGTPAPFVVTSADDAMTFGVPSARLPDTTVGIGALSGGILFGCGEQLDRSIDGGRSWTAVVDQAGGADCTIAFPNAATGYWIAPSSQTIWTTHNAGLSWNPFTFG